MDNSRALPPGTMVARDWRIERMLGAGGFGVTYEARHRTTGAHVALKEYMPSGHCTRVVGSSQVVVTVGPAGDVFKRGLQSFMKEAETLARLDHRAIVRVAEYFEANGTAYMALAYESGGSLAERIAKGPRLGQADLDRLLWPLLGALIQVHSLPLLHRDIKPANIMLRAEGSPVLIDFGAVKSLVSSASRSVNRLSTLNVASDGYAPPEQYIGDDDLLGPWTDIYGLGATIHECVTGEPPPRALRRQHEDTYRPLAKMDLGPGWRPQFLAAVDQALALKASGRPQSVVEFRRALGVTEPKPEPVAAQTAPSPRTAPAAVPSLPSRAVPSGAARTAGLGPDRASRAEPLRSAPAQPSPVIPPPVIPPPPGGLRPWHVAVGIAALGIAGGAIFWAGHRTGSGGGVTPSATTTAAATAPSTAPAPRPQPTTPVPATAAPASANVPTPVPVTRRPLAADPIATLLPGSGQSARDRLTDGNACSFCPELVVVPAGPFTMGSPASEPQRDSDESQVQVTIPRPFAVGKFAVTFDEWDACVADGGCGGYKPADLGWGRGKRPVINVNWNDAKVYAAWLSGKTGKTYRLPSEAEREYVTRAGTTTPFWWGSSITPAQANYDGSVEPYKGGGSKGEYRQRTVPVDSFQANPWGLFNVHGNVSEWTEDCWIDRNTGNPGNGEARTTGCTDASRRVVRGGSWLVEPQVLRSAVRYGGTSGGRGDDLGFRLARTLNP